MASTDKNKDTKSQDCYSICNKKYGSIDPKRIFCKKGCDSDEDTLFLLINWKIINFCLMIKRSMQKRNLFRPLY